MKLLLHVDGLFFERAYFFFLVVKFCGLSNEYKRPNSMVDEAKISILNQAFEEP